MKINKYIYLWVVQGYYYPVGWEDVTQSENWAEAHDNLRIYRYEKQTGFRIIKRRELNPEWIKLQ